MTGEGAEPVRMQPPAGMSGNAAAALSAALRAGRSVMEVYGTDFESQAKEDGSPLTEADLASHRIISGLLARTGIPVLSEEGNGKAQEGGRHGETWIVDPLDGTADFVGRTGEFTVMIALVRDGRPAVGVINCPAAGAGSGAAYIAESGRGAFRLAAGGTAWERIAASKTADLRGATAVVSRNHLTDRERGMLDSLGIAGREGVGSSLKACRIAEGSADVYLTYTDKMHVWDTAASECILAEAGGIMTDVGGAPLGYEGPGTRHMNGVLATNGPLHDVVLRQGRASAESP